MTAAISDDVRHRYNASVQRIREWDEAYYGRDDPLVADAVYDAEFRSLRSQELLYPDLITSDSPTQKVSGKPSKGFKTVKHAAPMISLYTETDFGIGGAVDFLKRLAKDLPEPPAIVVEPKYDGLALDLKYEYGILTQALTRGDGENGEDVSRNVVLIESIPKVIPTLCDRDVIHVRGEAMMPRSEFERLNALFREQGRPTLVNCRNAAAGALRQLDQERARERKLIFMAYGLADVHGAGDIGSQMALIDWFRAVGFTVSEECSYIPAADVSPETLFSEHCRIEAGRPEFDYDIDGVVYKVNSFALQAKLGIVSREPRWAVAHKFNPEETTTVLDAIDIQVGRTGQLTPVARLIPAFVGGTTVTNCTLHNVFEIRRKNIRAGDQVTLRRAGDVIPEILPRTIPRNWPFFYQPNFRMPKHCPECGAPTLRKKGAVKYYCTGGWTCPGQRTAQLLHFASRTAMDIQGLGDVMAHDLITKFRLADRAQLYRLDVNDFAGLDWGEKTKQNLINEIQRSREPSLERFLFALGIDTVGISTARALAQTFGTLENFMNADATSLASIRDVGPTTIQAILNYLASDSSRQELNRFAEVLSVPETPIRVYDESHQLYGKKVAVTGSFERITRGALETRLRELGVKIVGGITKSTDYLIAGATGGGDKRAQAEQKGVKVLSEAEVFPMLI